MNGHIFEEMVEERELIYSRSIGGISLMQKRKWEHLKCKNCGCELEITKSNEYEEVKTCPKCNMKHMLIKKIRKEE